MRLLKNFLPYNTNLATRPSLSEIEKACQSSADGEWLDDLALYVGLTQVSALWSRIRPNEAQLNILRPAEVQVWLKEGHDTEAAERTLVPINLGGRHWVLAIIQRTQPHPTDSTISFTLSVDIFDSWKSGKPCKEIEERIHQLCPGIVPPQVQQPWMQPNGYDCGIAVVANAMISLGLVAADLFHNSKTNMKALKLVRCSIREYLELIKSGIAEDLKPRAIEIKPNSAEGLEIAHDVKKPKRRGSNTNDQSASGSVSSHTSKSSYVALVGDHLHNTGHTTNSDASTGEPDLNCLYTEPEFGKEARQHEESAHEEHHKEPAQEEAHAAEPEDAPVEEEKPKKKHAEEEPVVSAAEEAAAEAETPAAEEVASPKSKKKKKKSYKSLKAEVSAPAAEPEPWAVGLP